jgi:pimeloyl-ACP methyl ester carboxylesterase
MPTIEGAGVELAYREQGAGPSVLLIHAIASDSRALEPVASALAGAGRRAIAYDRRGYGASGAPEPYDGTTVSEQAQDAVALLRELGAAPALVVGDGWGALIALDLLVREPDLVRGVVAADPPAYAFVPEATEALSEQRAALERALVAGGPPAAVRAWLDGRASGAALERAEHAHRAFFADYAGLSSWSVTRGELRAAAAPVTLLTGPATAPAVRAAADALAALLPDARRREDGDLVGAALEAAAR